MLGIGAELAALVAGVDDRSKAFVEREFPGLRSRMAVGGPQRGGSQLQDPGSVIVDPELEQGPVDAGPPPRRCMTPRTFSAEKKRSATMPTRKGATMAPQGMVL